MNSCTDELASSFHRICLQLRTEIQFACSHHLGLGRPPAPSCAQLPPPTRRWDRLSSDSVPNGEAGATAVLLVERLAVAPGQLVLEPVRTWDPKKTTKSTVAKRTTSTKQHSTQNTRRGRTNGKKRETNCTEGARRTTPSHRSQRCYTGHQKMLCLKFKR